MGTFPFSTHFPLGSVNGHVVKARKQFATTTSFWESAAPRRSEEPESS
jgi:hypothetical protein